MHSVFFVGPSQFVIYLGMSYDDREAIIGMDQDITAAEGNFEEQLDPAFSTLPPGDEGFDISHEGGEYEVFNSFTHDLEELAGV